MAKNPGRVITEDILSSLVGSALSQSHTPINVFRGFKKAGIYPFNLGEVSDRQLAPSKAFSNRASQVPLEFSPGQVTQFEKRYAEDYDVPDTTYLAWKNMYHPSPASVVSTEAISDSPTSVSVCGAKSTTTTSSAVSVMTTQSLPSSEDFLSELLVLPKPVRKTGRTRNAINQKAVEISDSMILQEMRDKEQAKADANTLKEKKLERQKKARERQEEKERKKKERGRKAQERQEKKEKKRKQKRRKSPRNRELKVQHLLLELRVYLISLIIVDDGQCFNCDLIFNEDNDDRFWVGCDGPGCENW